MALSFSQKRYDVLADQAESARSAYLDVSENCHKTRVELQRVEADARERIDYADTRYSFDQQTHDLNLAGDQVALRQLRNEMRRLLAAQKTAAARQAATLPPFDRAKKWLHSHRGVLPRESEKLVTGKIPVAGKLAAVLDQTAAEIERLLLERTSIENMPADESTIKARIDNYISGIRSDLSLGGERFVLPDSNYRRSENVGAHRSPLELAALLDPDALRAGLLDEAMHWTDGKPGVSEIDRRKQLGALDADLDRLHHRHVDLTFAALDAGQAANFHRDVPVEALLDTQGKQSPPTSRMPPPTSMRTDRPIAEDVTVV